MSKKPTQEELSSMIDKGLGTLLVGPEIEKRIKSGELPENFKVDEGFGVYLIEVGGSEYLCVTNILCDKCQRVNGKVKKCPAHKRKRRTRKSRSKEVKEGDVQDDASDRDKLGNLRHVDDDDDEEDKIEGALTPDAVMTPGVGGAIILVPVDSRNNDKAAPPAKGLNHVKGILVRGAGNIPQFIPNDRLTKAHKLRFDNYIEGELLLQTGMEIFVPNGLGAAKMDGKNTQAVAKAAVADKVDPKIVELIGGKDMVLVVQADVADNGLPVMKVLDEKPKDKDTAVGIVIRTNDGVQFCQIAGRELGGGKDAKMLACTVPENGKPGDAVADVYINAEGKAVAVKPGEVMKGGTLAGQVVVGLNDQLVFVPKGENKQEWINKGAITPAMKEKLELAECKVQAAVTGQSEDHINQQINKIGMEAAAANAAAQQGGNGGSGGGAQGGPGEVRSVGFGAQQFGGSCFAKASPGGGGGGGGGSGGGGGGGSGGGGGKQYGSGGEVRSMAMGGNQFGGSVMAKASPGGGVYGGGGGGNKGAAGGGGGAKGVSGAAGGKGGNGGGGGGGGGTGEVRSVAMGSGVYGGGGEVRSVAMGSGAYGASVQMKAGGSASPAPKTSGGGKGGANQGSGADARSIGFGNQFGGSVYMKK